ncbi:BirA family transcriptional regulator, biotin operon repressor / biotin---[acetyl-CoA-carboxylase] ligase [Anaerolineales bacterium]|nr:BirA family transcriptional regulator, biotin operon repressor / biotin---[acetyl-CoA-carboxylase] ligase [Anaerolineales bacterium]
MNEHSLRKKLSKLDIGGLRYFDSIGSTNDEALAWATSGAPDFSLVIADEQTHGRGRLDRKWFTPKRSGLAVSLILRLPASHLPYFSRTGGLAALSIAETCSGLGLAPRIKWPNDILINSKKVAGILIENIWAGDEVDSLVIGMGVNVYKDSVPPAELLQFPATSLEDELGKNPPAREEILFKILSAFTHWRERIGTDELIQIWEKLLAFRGDQVQVSGDIPITGELLGLESDGSLRLRDASSKSVIVRFGDVSLRPGA